MSEDQKLKERRETIENSGLAGAQTEVVQRYGSAIKEHLSAYSGVDQEKGRKFRRSLKSIARYKINPNDRERVIKSQSGFSAEVKTVARENADKIISGESIRVTRTDDIPKQAAENGCVGGTNDPLFDIVSIDKDGFYIEGSGRQLKYVGKDARDCCKKLLGKSYDKYREADACFEVPKELFADVCEELDRSIDDQNKQIQLAEERRDAETAKKYREQLGRTQKTRNNLREGKLTTAEAIEARLHPKISTAKDILGVSHRAGTETAKSGAAIGGGMSFIRNSVAVMKGDEDVSSAITSVAMDTASAAGLSYATGFVGSAIKGGMQNASSSYIQALSKTNLPGTIVTVVVETGKTLSKYADGKIDGTECLTELGEKGAGMLASAMGATIGQALIPIPILGGMIGGMFGYALSSMYYENLVSALNEAKLAKEQRTQIEAECKNAIAAIQEYRLEIELVVRNYFIDQRQIFTSALCQIEESFHTADVNQMIKGANQLTEALGEEVLFRTSEELDDIMGGDGRIII